MKITDAIACFTDYTAGFLNTDASTAITVRLKIEHSFKVLDAARLIAAGENLAPDVAELTENAALFHDYGRFEQLRQYRTLSDAHSCDHGKLGVRLLREHRVFADRTMAERTLLYTAIVLHNREFLPAALGAGNIRTVAGIIRDADKIDIMRVLFENLSAPNVTWNLDPAPVLSPAVRQSLERQCPVSNCVLRTRTDFLTAKLAWVYDLNTDTARKLYRERRLLPKLREQLPPLPELNPLFEAAQKRLESR